MEANCRGKPAKEEEQPTPSRVAAGCAALDENDEEDKKLLDILRRRATAAPKGTGRPNPVAGAHFHQAQQQQQGQHDDVDMAKSEEELDMALRAAGIEATPEQRRKLQEECVEQIAKRARTGGAGGGH